MRTMKELLKRVEALEAKVKLQQVKPDEYGDD